MREHDSHECDTHEHHADELGHVHDEHECDTLMNTTPTSPDTCTISTSATHTNTTATELVSP